MRTQDEIVTRIEKVKVNDLFNFEWTEYTPWLDWEHVQQFLVEDHGLKEEKWEVRENSKEEILKIMGAYMEFAWDKANNCRGLSAGRSMGHYIAWIWMLGDEEVSFFGDLGEYEHYGKDNLVKICERYHWNHAQWDDGVRVNAEDEL